MSMQAKLFLVIGALSALLSVAIGAATAHVPNDNLAAGQHWLATAMQYHQFHSLALIGVGLAMAVLGTSRWLTAAGVLMVIGLLLFSGNLYLRSLAGFHDLHAVTPFGGGAFLLGWLAFANGVLAYRRG
jgi:uncharacterized membrane protein YgdD (TMEM256/DUF423 family)